MRIWICCIFILLVSTLCRASSAPAWSIKTKHSANSEVAQTPAVEHNSGNQHCDQLEDTEAIAAAYTQYNTFSPVLPIVDNWLKPVFYPVIGTRLATRRNNARIQPFYKLILFPFHVFW